MTPKILTLGVLLLVISISNEPAGAEDQRLMMKSGRPVTVADLTLVPSDVAQRSVKDASQGWTLEGHRETEMSCRTKPGCLSSVEMRLSNSMIFLENRCRMWNDNVANDGSWT